MSRSNPEILGISKISREEAYRRVSLVTTHGIRGAAGIIGISRSSLQYSLKNIAKHYKMRPRIGVGYHPGHKPRYPVVGDAPTQAAQQPEEQKPLFKRPMELPAIIHGPKHVFLTDADGSFTFGAMGDTHLGSKYERLDVLEALYDAYEAAGITTVFHTGNWIDGEARFNVYDLHTRGMDAQCRYLAKVYPRRPGITTYAVAGDDHEGWYAQREGVDIGAYAEQKFREAGRTDWVNLGYMEAAVLLRNRNSGKDATISVVHPGGGSSYAVSYTIQKIIEGLDGGEKPSIGLYGHYHKMMFGNVRNVWAAQTGCTQDQTPFMRKKKIDAHVGGLIMRAVQHEPTGAIIRCSADYLRFYNRGFYNGRWSHSGDVTLPDRSLNGV